MWQIKYSTNSDHPNYIIAESIITIENIRRIDIGGACTRAIELLQGVSADTVCGDFSLQWIEEDIVATYTREEFVERLKKNVELRLPTATNTPCPICRQPITRGQWQSEDIGLYNNRPAHAECCALQLGKEAERHGYQ
jgi:hypothetical protein